MAGVAGVFFVLLAIFMVKDARRDQHDKVRLAAFERDDYAKNNARAKVEQALAALAAELGALKSDLENGGVEAVLADNELVINVDPQGVTLRFESGQDHLDPAVASDARRRVRQTLEIVCRVVRRTNVPLIKHIVLEGHTDNLRLLNVASASSRSGLLGSDDFRVSAFGGNVDLSSRRAVHILRLVMEDPASDSVLRDCIEDHFLIAGRGPVQPVDEMGQPMDADWFTAGPSDAARARSRRVVLRVSGRQDYDKLAKELAAKAPP